MTERGTPLLCFNLEERRALARHGESSDRAPFAALATSLSADLEPLIDAPLPIPEHKARLTRYGGRCPTHGTFLDFDPWKSRDHWCPRCERSHQGRHHDDWWAMGAQLWTAERAVHAAALFALRGDPRHATLAARILREYGDRYDRWPNADNVLGPTRPFFSTYLESIWLLNLCHALALLEDQASAWTANDRSMIRDRVLAPSAALIDRYHERGSNRQVWNEVAISSAWCLMGREDETRRRLDSEGGLRWQIANGLDAAGSWYEGENYHLFAHRGLWYGVQLMRALDEPLSPELSARYAEGFAAPFAGLLPDDTFPSRRDSQYASSIRQWRTAEWCELGWAHTHDRRLASVLTRMYDGAVPRRDTGRARSTADAERNTLASSLTRADLSWRALLMAEAQQPPVVSMAWPSVCLPAQGLAVIRRDEGKTYVALEGGQLGGGHGHPDQLALTLQTGVARWLEDPGTGSYVEAELQWYRSTLAHSAPLIDRASQLPVPARLVAFEDVGEAAWMVKRVDGMADGVQVDRTIVVCDGYLVDVVEWNSSEEHFFELPIAGAADLMAPIDEGFSTPAESEPRDDGVDIFLGTMEVRPLNESVELRPHATFAEAERSGASPRTTATGQIAGDCARLWYAVDGAKPTPDDPAVTLFRSQVPAAPWHGLTDRHWLGVYRARGRVVGVWSWPSEAWPLGAVSSVHLSPDTMPCVRVTTSDGATATHARTDAGWEIDIDKHDARHRVTLAGFRTDASAPVPEREIPLIGPRAEYAVPLLGEVPDTDPVGSPLREALVVELGESHYVPTEPSWSEAGEPTATVQIGATTHWLIVDVHAHTGPLMTDQPALVDRLDNENPDVNADGLQWYMARTDPPSSKRGWHAAALHVPSPRPDDASRSRETTITGNMSAHVVQWGVTPDGWSMRVRWPRAALPLDADGALYFELVVNERPPERERRRGQLVLSGGGGFGYLMGDRRPTDRFVRLVLPLAPAETTLR
ncbi:MAG: heparinase II/III family protein [Gemmatimonas sp.]